jgi:hypothetical protein
MNWPKLGLVVMFTLGLLSMFPLVTVREPFMKQVLDHERNAQDRFNGWNACQRGDGRFAGVVRETLHNDDEWFYRLEVPGVTESVRIVDSKTGKVVSERIRPKLVTRPTWSVWVTRDDCPIGRVH